MVSIPIPSKKTKAPTFFLDSGAHSLFNIYAYKVKNPREKYAYYKTKEFWDYVDSYASFIKEHSKQIDYYVNVDAIHNPEITWEVQKYLEDKHHLSPIPVVHAGTPIKWMDRYLTAGYNYIGLGGVALEGSRQDYFLWADSIFNMVCPSPTYLPTVKLHGFAMTAYSMIIRYPWYSTDSSSWAKAAAFGSIYVPHKVRGDFHFEVSPYTVCFSHRSPSKGQRGKVLGRHYETLPSEVQSIVRSWLSHINIPLGKMDGDEIIEEGVINHYGSRGVANMRFFEAMCKSLPAWPWPFCANTVEGFGL